jgi:hypothetical protein
VRAGFLWEASGKDHYIDHKKRRMRIIALNGLLVMLPAAFFLDSKASAGELDALFYVVQAIELSVGIVQILLMGKNFRDGERDHDNRWGHVHAHCRQKNGAGGHNHHGHR